MKKKNNSKVAMIIASVLILVIGGWIAIVGYYSISNVSEAELRDFNPVATLLVFISISIALMLILSIKRNKKEDNLEVRWYLK